MRKLSRRHKKNVEKTKNKIYANLDEAVQVLKETATSQICRKCRTTCKFKY